MSIEYELCLAFLLYNIIINSIFSLIWYIKLARDIEILLKCIRDFSTDGIDLLDGTPTIFEAFDFLESLLSKISKTSQGMSNNNYMENIIAVNEIKNLHKEFLEFTMTKSEKRDSVIQDILN